jgi:Domain of Unknown Function (DUF1206)
MNYEPRALRRAEAQGEAVSRSSAFEWFARAGFAARGLIYGLVGLLALELALGEGGETTSQQGALKELAQQPFGEALLIATAIGLAGYATWRFVRAALGHGKESEDDTVERIGGVVSGIGYAILCLAAVDILIGSSGGSGGASQTTGGVLGWTGGPWIVGIAGAATIGEGLHQGYKGVTKEFLEKSKTEQMTPGVKSAFTKLGIFGHLARMVVFMLIGYFLLKAAIDYNPDAAVTLDGALGKLTQAAYGPLALGVVAAGLLGFGLYSLADARYRRV